MSTAALLLLTALAIAIFALWRVLKRRGRGEVTKVNFDALKDKEMRRNRLASFVALAVLFTTPAFAQSPAQPKPAPQGGTITDNYGNRKGYITPQGVVTDNYGNRIGYIKPDGTATDNYGNRIGKVKKP